MKGLLNISWSQIIEQENANFPELMTSIVPAANGTGPITVIARGAGGDPPGEGKSIGVGSALQSCVWFKDGLPYLDFVDTASINDDGTITPGIDLGSDPVIVTWYHIPGDGDALNAWWM